MHIQLLGIAEDTKKIIWPAQAVNDGPSMLVSGSVKRLAVIIALSQL